MNVLQIQIANVMAEIRYAIHQGDTRKAHLLTLKLEDLTLRLDEQSRGAA